MCHHQRLQNYIFGKIQLLDLRLIKGLLIVSGICTQVSFIIKEHIYNYWSKLIADILMQYSRGKSALVFCSTRRGAQEAAQRLSQIVMTFGYSNPFIKSREQQERLREASLSCSDKQMQSYILYGGKGCTYTAMTLIALKNCMSS